MTDRTKKLLDYIVSTHAIEHLTISEEAQRLCLEISKGRISASEAMQKIMLIYGIERQKDHS